MNLKERVRYLEGLSAGLKPDDGSAGSRVLGGMLEILDAMATRLDEMTESHANLQGYVEMVDADLAQVEEGLVRTGVLLSCSECGQPLEVPPEDEEGHPDITCPSCGIPVYEHRDDFEPVDEPEEMTGSDLPPEGLPRCTTPS
ncbi:MAG TPA: hypothetical protein VLK32_06595 [Bacillota bacterium]|nr:hypothetical protein [Bacillota bacterium]